MSSAAAGSSVISNSVRSEQTSKYDGMIKQSFYKVARTKLSDLYNYIYADAPYMNILHIVITFFRIFQIIGPSLCPANPLWDSDSKMEMFVNILSVLWQIIPSSVHNDGIVPFLLLYDGLMAFFGLLILGSAFYFAKFAKLNVTLSISILVFFSTANLVFHPIAINFAFEMISRLAFTDYQYFDEVSDIIIIVITLVIYFLYLWNSLVILSQSLTFRPTSMMTVLPAPSDVLMGATNLINALIGLSTFAPKTGRTVILAVTVLAYALIIYVPFLQGGFVKRLMNSMVTACGIEGILLCLVQIIVSLIGGQMNAAVIIVAGILFPILTIIFNIVNHRIAVKNLITLDYVQENNDFEVIRNTNNFFKVVIDGMVSIHPVCIPTWQIFRDAVMTWPRKASVWFIFAKFVAIYPEDVQTLNWIYHSVTKEKLKCIAARTIKYQTLSISRQRESALSPNLKSKLTFVQKSMVGAKHKLRHVWDMAIQGNVNEMESAIKKAFEEQDKVEAEFKHLFRQFPNNRFVTRTYARFSKELKADQVEYLDYLEKSRLLQRGIPVCIDQAHESAIRAFPSLPSKIQVAKNDNAPVPITDNFQSLDDVVDDDTADDVSVNTFRESIKSIHVPAVVGTLCIRFWMFLIIFIGYLVAMFVYSNIFIDMLMKPLNHFKWIAYARLNALDIGLFTTHQAYECLDVYNKPIEQEILPTYFGGQWNTLNMLKLSLREATRAAQEMTAFQEYESDDEDIIGAKSWIFDKKLYYTFKYNPVDNNISYMDIQTGIITLVSDATTIANMKKSDYFPEFVNTTAFLNPIANNDGIAALTFKAGKKLISFSQTQYVQTVNETKVIKIAAITATCTFFIAEVVVQVIWIQKNKEEAYKCLTSLPKNVVSELVENLRVLKHDDENGSPDSTNNSELNKQEDNILKTFMTGGNSIMRVTDRIMIIASSIMLVVLSVISTILFCNLFEKLAWNMVKSSPHLFYISGAFTKFFESQYMIQLIGLRSSNHPLREYNFEDGYLEERFIDLVVTGREYYQSARWGGAKKEEAPFDGYMKTMESAKKLIHCDNPKAKIKDFMDIVACWNVDALLMLSDAIMTKYYEKIYTTNLPINYTIDPNDTMLDYLWTMLISPIYEGLYAPMFDSIIPTIDETLNNEKTKTFTIVGILLGLGFLFELFAFVQLSYIDKHIKQTLMLLLHANQRVIMSVPKISQVISGDFSRHRGDTTKRNAEFYDAVFNNLPDAVLVINPINRNIDSVNRSCLRMLGKQESELVGTNIYDLLHSDKFKGDSSSLFSGPDNSTPILMTTTDEEGGQMNLSMESLNINKVQAIVIRDVTTIMRYNRLIADERAKSDNLLESILPATLVKRVQNGEKNISFAVQSATIVFMDIVSFTPWCGSIPADKVMLTLNKLFKKFDNSLAKYGTMTKIKCIGDCYMAAGGIFAENNQPAEHAKEVVSFGLDCLDNVKAVNSELEEKLQMRVGINTGGPIVAGVLGIGKPTFEILGPAINMAQQMEHHGIASSVQISRSVYELIYGETFKIKERGNVEVKNSTVVTYIVSRK